jgi:hypothetical protein
MVFGIEKYKALSIAKGNLEMRNCTTGDADTMGVMNENDIDTWVTCNLNKLIAHK